MYQEYGDKLTITVNDWCKAGLTKNQFNHDSKEGYLTIAHRGIRGNTLIDVKSIQRPERLQAIEAAFGKLEKVSVKSIFTVEIDAAARSFYLRYKKPDGSPLSPENIEKYVNRASIFNGIKRGLERQMAARAKSGQRISKGKFWELAKDWYAEQLKAYPCAPIGNVKSLQRAFKSYLKDGYASIIHKNEGNDAARKVSTSLEKLLLALWRRHDKPFVNVVRERYLEFVSGSKELHDTKTGEVFRPSDFCYKGRAMEVSVATVWNYLKDVVNETSVYADRNGNFDFVNAKRPKHHRKAGKFSLSKISMDDVAMSRKSNRGWIYKYIAVDVVSGYWFRPAYVVGKPTANTVIEAFRNMFCELTDLGLPMPGELEVEYHLMQDFKWLGEQFPFVRFCESPTEKRAEHKIKSLKYGVAKREGHTRGRWYAKHEAWRSVRNKVDGDFVEPTYQPQTIVADDLGDIEKHNNEPHPLQKTYPGMTRKQVLLYNINPKLKPIEPWHLYRYIGNETETSIYNNDYCPVQGENFELMDYASLKRLKPNNVGVTAYWLPVEDGSVSKVYLWQGETYIGEALNRSEFDYNECAAERDDEDKAAMLHQQKRLAEFDKFLRDERAEIPHVGMMDAAVSARIAAAEAKVVEEPEQPESEEEFACETNNWAAWAEARAKASL